MLFDFHKQEDGWNWMDLVFIIIISFYLLFAYIFYFLPKVIYRKVKSYAGKPA
jgi:hypothetical protein